MKIQCSCGTKYAFDISPEMARTPITFVCKTCGADSSGMINQLIRQELGLPPPAATALPASPQPAVAPPPTTDPVTVRVNVAPRTPASAPPVQESAAPPPVGPARVRVSIPSSPAAALAAAAPGPAAPQLCLKHPGQLAAHRCVVCQKPICSDCMEVFGFVCSALCRAKAESQGIEVPAYESQRSATAAREWR